MKATISDLMELKKKASEIRDNVLKANATMKEVNNNIESVISDLKELGIKNTENADDEILKMEAKAQELYEASKKKIDKWL